MTAEQMTQLIVTVEQVNGEWCVVLFRAQSMPVVLPYQDNQTAELVARGFRANLYEVFAVVAKAERLTIVAFLQDEAVKLRSADLERQSAALFMAAAALMAGKGEQAE
jgi:hypothetical protein